MLRITLERSLVTESVFRFQPTRGISSVGQTRGIWGSQPSRSGVGFSAFQRLEITRFSSRLLRWSRRVQNNPPGKGGSQRNGCKKPPPPPPPPPPTVFQFEIDANESKVAPPWGIHISIWAVHARMGNVPQVSDISGLDERRRRFKAAFWRHRFAWLLMQNENSWTIWDDTCFVSAYPWEQLPRRWRYRVRPPRNFSKLTLEWSRLKKYTFLQFRNVDT
jgi:hypothetical protein